MFGRKKENKKAVPKLVRLSADGETLQICPTGEYILPEPVVLALSTEYFNDPEPCHIHRGAVHKRAMMELIEHCPANETIAVNGLPEPMRAYFPEGTAFVRIEVAS